MKTTTQILAAFSLMSAVTLHAAPPITITSLPFTVSSPGTYVLAQDLTFSGNGIAISIPTNLPGQVIVDLKGHTITGTGGGTGVGIGGDFTGPLVSNTSPITVRNGTL